MALKIRLTRIGAKKKPVYRLIVSENLKPRDGKFIDFLGLYDPLEDDLLKNINEDRILHWLRNGAKPTETAKSLLRKAGILAKWKDPEGNSLTGSVTEKAPGDAADIG